MYAPGSESAWPSGSVWLPVSLIADVATKQVGWPSPGFALVNILVIAPLFEEIVSEDSSCESCRTPGRVLAGKHHLRVDVPRLHLPGWYFVGLVKPRHAVVALGICLVGLVAGSARRRAGSTWAAVAVHFVNNLYSSFMH